MDIYPEVRYTGYMVVLFIIFWGIAILFFIVEVPIYIPTNIVQGFSFLLNIARIFTFVFFITDILTVVRWYFIVVCISLIICDVEHLWKNVDLKTAHLKIGLFVVFFFVTIMIMLALYNESRHSPFSILHVTLKLF